MTLLELTGRHRTLAALAMTPLAKMHAGSSVIRAYAYSAEGFMQ